MKTSVCLTATEKFRNFTSYLESFPAIEFFCMRSSLETRLELSVTERFKTLEILWYPLVHVGVEGSIVHTYLYKGFNFSACHLLPITISYAWRRNVSICSKLRSILAFNKVFSHLWIFLIWLNFFQASSLSCLGNLTKLKYLDLWPSKMDKSLHFTPKIVQSMFTQRPPLKAFMLRGERSLVYVDEGIKHSLSTFGIAYFDVQVTGCDYIWVGGL